MTTKTTDTKRQARAWYRHLNQDTTWIPVTGVPVRIAGMDPAWRFNAANWLIKRAPELAVAYVYGEGLLMAEPLGRDELTGQLVYVEMPAEVDLGDDRDSFTAVNDPEGWMRTTDLYQSLVKDLPGNTADLAKHWSTCDLRTGKATACSCWQRHLSECPVYDRADVTLTCHCNDNSPEWTI